MIDSEEPDYDAYYEFLCDKHDELIHHYYVELQQKAASPSYNNVPAKKVYLPDDDLPF